jgi:hypothetical protein
MTPVFLDQTQIDPLERSGAGIAVAALGAAATVWALATISLRFAYTSYDPVVFGFVCAAAAAWDEERLIQTTIIAAWGVVAGAAAVLLNAGISIPLVPWIVTGAGVALATATLGRRPARMIAAVPAGALATLSGYVLGAYLLPAEAEQLPGIGYASLAQPMAALMLVVISVLMITVPRRGEPQIVINRYRQKSSRLP